jgi:hypothetical protein
VFLAGEPAVMRKGFEGLAAFARSAPGEELLSGHVFVFSNVARTRLKLLFWDGSGLCLCSKRLERARFVWPPAAGAESSPSKLRFCGAAVAVLVGGEFTRASGLLDRRTRTGR